MYAILGVYFVGDDLRGSAVDGSSNRLERRIACRYDDTDVIHMYHKSIENGYHLPLGTLERFMTEMPRTLMSYCQIEARGVEGMACLKATPICSAFFALAGDPDVVLVSPGEKNLVVRDRKRFSTRICIPYGRKQVLAVALAGTGRTEEMKRLCRTRIRRSVGSVCRP